MKKSNRSFAGCNYNVANTRSKTLSISTKLKLYNLRVLHKDPDFQEDTEDSTPSNSAPLIKAPPHLSPKAFIKFGVKQGTAIHPVSSKVPARRIRIALGAENIEDADVEHNIPRTRDAKKLLSSRSPSPTTEANTIPSVQRYNCLNQIKIRIKSARIWTNKHNYLSNSRSLRGMVQKTMCAWMQCDSKIDKEGYLWKLSRKKPGIWQPKYCILKNHSFIWVKHRGVNKVQGCVQFEYFKEFMELSSSKDHHFFT